jgi:hypothetical protein
MALAFAPLPIVRQTFHILETMPSNDLRVAPIYQYFRQQWIMSIPPKMWNVYKVNIRTNNHLEGWHNRFANLVSRHRPNIWRLLACIQQEQSATEITIQQIISGQQVQKKVKRYEKIQRNLKRLLRRYRRGTIDVVHYITGVSHNLAQFP